MAAQWAGYKCATQRKPGRAPNHALGGQLVYITEVPGKGVAAQLTVAGLAEEARLKNNNGLRDTYNNHGAKGILDTRGGQDQVLSLTGAPAVAAAAHNAVLTAANVNQAPSPTLDIAMASGVQVGGLPLVSGPGGSRSQQCVISATVRIADHAWNIDHSVVPIHVTTLTDMRPVACRPCARAPPASEPCP